MTLPEFIEMSNAAMKVSDEVLNKQVDFYDIMDFAILKEEEAHDQLMELCNKVQNMEAKEALQRLALEELQHIKLLENIMDGGPENFHVSEIKLEDYQTRECTKDIKEDATVKEVLEFVICQERDSHLFYKDMARAYKDKETKDTLVKLARLELDHQIRLEKIYKKYFAN